MKIVISPAKTINETSVLPTERYSTAIFPKEIAEVHAALKPLSPQKLSDLMGISSKLAELNWQRNQTFAMPFTPKMHVRHSLLTMAMYMRGLMPIHFLKRKLTNCKGVYASSLDFMEC